jgi:hypothetical protein
MKPYTQPTDKQSPTPAWPSRALIPNPMRSRVQVIVAVRADPAQTGKAAT